VNNDFKKASYLLTIIFFLLGITALVGVSAAKYFQFDELVVTVSQIASLAAFFIMFINCIYSKSKYNSACIRFADYILTNRRKEEERKAADAERMKELQSIREAAEHDRDKAIEAARQQGRSEGAQTASELSAVRQQMPAQPPMQSAQPMSAFQPNAVQPPRPMPQQRMPVQAAPVQRMPAQQLSAPASVPQRMPEPQRNRSVQREPAGQFNEEVLYNEYGEPVMMRRRVRKTPSSPEGEMLYDSHGNPVVRRNQGLWEPLEQRHEIVFKFETSPGVTVSQQGRNPQQDRSDDVQ
jgi:Predicted membrane protein